MQDRHSLVLHECKDTLREGGGLSESSPLPSAAAGKVFTEAHKLALSASKKNSQKISVLDLQTGIETPYASINEAARLLGFPKDSVRANMKSKNQKPYKGQYLFKKID